VIPYFSYGQRPEVISQLTTDAALLGPANLPGYKLAGSTIYPAEGEVVEGALWRFRERNWHDLDEFAGERYCRIDVRVLFWGEMTPAEAYCLRSE
jgi:gamma-glutamylcyclotransferase (GGCT)/AIG2-like uncharacterized protein YtfP